MTRYCEECGCEIEDWIEGNLCEDCMNDLASAIINTDDIWPNEEDF